MGCRNLIDAAFPPRRGGSDSTVTRTHSVVGEALSSVERWDPAGCNVPLNREGKDGGPGTIGMYMGSTAAGFILGSFVSGRFAAHYPLTTMIVAGRVVAFAGLTVGLGLLLAGIVHEFSLFGSCVFLGVGNGISMPSSNVGAMSVRPELVGSAAGLSGALTGAGGALMSGITSTVLTGANAAFVLLGMML